MEEIKQGYKQTDIGVIPEDWEVLTIGELCSISIGKDVDFNKFNTNTNSEYPYPVYSNTVENYGLYGYYKTPQYSENAVTVVGRGIGLGTAFARYIPFGAIGRLVVLCQKKHFNPTYLSSYINSQIEIFSESGGIPQLTGISFSKYLIAIPCEYKEQTAIATALSDTDALIAALDKKIAKKQQIKQGAMQQLLTGKKRLPGFSGEWVEKTVGSVCIVKRGQMIVSSEFVTGSIPVIAGGMSPAGYHNASNRNENTITISASGANAGFIGFHKFPIFASDCSTINENENIDIHFIYYTLKLKQEEIYKCQTGGAQPHIHPKDIEPLILNFPTDKPEQTAIAQILTDMDNEIAQLEKERDKYKELKAGMMQVLLTGKIRLI